jgi:hypothetical protein
VTIYSRQAIVRLEKAERTSPYVFDQVGFCLGTTIDINLRTDTIEVLPGERKDLQW